MRKMNNGVKTGTSIPHKRSRSIAIDALDYEHNHDARTQSPHLTAARLQLAVGRHGFGPENKEGKTYDSTNRPIISQYGIGI